MGMGFSANKNDKNLRLQIFFFFSFGCSCIFPACQTTPADRPEEPSDRQPGEWYRVYDMKACYGTEEAPELKCLTCFRKTFEDEEVSYISVPLIIIIL